MSDGQGAALPVGPVLRDSIVLILRHPVILILSMLVLAGISLLNLSLLGRCFGNFPPSCPSWVTTLGPRTEWLTRSVMDEVAAFIVGGAAIYFLYSSGRIQIAELIGLTKSRTRILRVFERLAVVSVVVLIPIYAFDLALSELAESFPSLVTSATMQWLVFVVRTVIVVAFSAYVHARLALYLPAAALSAYPEGWRGSWSRTRGNTGRLFTAFFLIGISLSGVQVGLAQLAYRSPLYLDAVVFVSDFLGGAAATC